MHLCSTTLWQCSTRHDVTRSDRHSASDTRMRDDTRTRPNGPICDYARETRLLQRVDPGRSAGPPGGPVHVACTALPQSDARVRVMHTSRPGTPTRRRWKNNTPPPSRGSDRLAGGAGPGPHPEHGRICNARDSYGHSKAGPGWSLQWGFTSPGRRRHLKPYK